MKCLRVPAALTVTVVAIAAPIALVVGGCHDKIIENDAHTRAGDGSGSGSGDGGIRDARGDAPGDGSGDAGMDAGLPADATPDTPLG